MRLDDDLHSKNEKKRAAKRVPGGDKRKGRDKIRDKRAGAPFGDGSFAGPSAEAADETTAAGAAAGGGAPAKSLARGAAGGANGAADAAAGGGGGAGEGGAGGGEGDWSGERYEKTPAATRYLLRFTRRTCRLPEQCVRYDYGGEPLWPVPPPPVAVAASPSAPAAASAASAADAPPRSLAAAVVTADGVHDADAARAAMPAAAAPAAGARSTGKGSGKGGSVGKKGKGGAPHMQRRARPLLVPRCSCGAARRFEMQLMPHCLEVLGADITPTEALMVAASAPTSAATASAGSAVATPAAAGGAGGSRSAAAASAPVHAADAGRLLLGGGMDFLTVLVYSCEDSCGAGSEEFAVAVCDGDAL